jgi:hypothetical protein
MAQKRPFLTKKRVGIASALALVALGTAVAAVAAVSR